MRTETPVEMIRARLTSSVPLASVTTRYGSRRSMPTTYWAERISAPKRDAWADARDELADARDDGEAPAIAAAAKAEGEARAAWEAKLVSSVTNSFLRKIVSDSSNGRHWNPPLS